MISYNFMTPVDDDNSAYYWFQHYNTDPDNEAVAKQLNQGAIAAFNEDREVLEAVHVGMRDQLTPNINLGLDAGAVRFRELMKRSIAAEQKD
jgi:vanillate O-demethylase monooxygenase subunit